MTITRRNHARKTRHRRRNGGSSGGGNTTGYIEIQSEADVTNIAKFNAHIATPGAKTFVLFYLEGCGPCIATRPEWSKLRNVISASTCKRNNILIASVNQSVYPKLHLPGKHAPEEFPTIRYYSDVHRESGQNFHDSSAGRAHNDERTIDAFVDWIEGEYKHAAVAAAPPLDSLIIARQTYKHNNRSRRHNKKR